MTTTNEKGLIFEDEQRVLTLGATGEDGTDDHGTRWVLSECAEWDVEAVKDECEGWLYEAISTLTKIADNPAFKSIDVWTQIEFARLLDAARTKQIDMSAY